MCRLAVAGISVNLGAGGWPLTVIWPGKTRLYFNPGLGCAWAVVAMTNARVADTIRALVAFLMDVRTEKTPLVAFR